MLVASDSALHESSMKEVVTGSGVCQNGDVLLLMSDAVASWCLQRFENGDLDVNEFLGASSDDELRQFFDDEREAGRIRNDDVAMVRIEMRLRSL